MRTTLDIDGDVLAAAHAIAEAESRSLGSVISELARRGLTPPQQETGAFPTFDVPANAAPITPDMVDRADV